MERAMTLPFTIDESGSVGSSNDIRKIWQTRVISCVMTSEGERVHRPMYGGDIKSALFATETDAAAIIDESVRNSFVEYLPSLTLNSVATSMDTETGALSATIYYTLPSGEQDSALLKTGFLTRSGELIQE